MSTLIATVKQEAPADCAHDRVARSLLGYGVLAGPLYIAAVLVQALWLRPGFDLVHDDASLLSNGTLGWIQIVNFLVTGAMVVLCAEGVRRSTRSTWAPILLAVFGAGMIVAGVFVADPMNGFPAGAPAGRPEAISVHGILHIAGAGIGFLGFVAACFVMARRFAVGRDRTWMWLSLVVGIVFLAAFAGVASGSASSVVVIGFWIGLVAAFGWIAALSIRLYRAV